VIAGILAVLAAAGAWALTHERAREVEPGPADDGIARYACGRSPAFTPDVLTRPLGVEQRTSDPAVEALVAFLRHPVGIDTAAPMSLRELVRTADAALYGTAPIPGVPDDAFSYVELHRDGRRWAYVSSGACRPDRVRPGLEIAEWQPVDPSALGPKTVALDVRVTPRFCSSGRATPGDEILSPEIVVEQTQIIVTWFAHRWVTGAQTCPGSEPTAKRLVLPEPLGDRRLVDGRRLPFVPVDAR
jgi:hypothetical protein